MANEKVYVGEDGAKELYRKIKALIPDSANAWKQWSEDNGSTGIGDSVYLGANNTLSRNDAYALGKGNTALITDETDYSNTDILLFGTGNSATNAANAYQIGRENTVTGNNLLDKLIYPHSVAINMGRNNDITAEGVNIGKDNRAAHFSVNLGQNNLSDNASVSIGQHVKTDDASLAMGNGLNYTVNPTVNNVPSLLVNNKYQHVSQFRIKTRYELYDRASVYKDTTDNKYKWVRVQEPYIEIYPNYELDQYLVSWGSCGSSGPYTGYFDAQGNFIPSTDTTKDIHSYFRIGYVGNKSGSERVNVNFYANGTTTINDHITYLMRPGATIPAYGTILNKAEYDAFVAGAIIPSTSTQVSNLFVNPLDLSADGYTISSLSSDTSYPFVLSYEVFGYKENGVLVPYNDITKDSGHTFDWYEVEASAITSQTLPVSEVKPDAELVTAINKSAALGVGSMFAGERSIAIATSNASDYQISYKNSISTYLYRTYSSYANRRYDIDQETGEIGSINNVSVSMFNDSNVFDYMNSLTPAGAYATGGSLLLSTGGARAYGTSVAIGNNCSASGYSCIFGNGSSSRNGAYAFGYGISSYDSSMALGFNGTSASKGSITFGYSGVSTTNKSMAFGFDGLYASDNSMAIGFSGSANTRGMIIGYTNFASSDGIAIGRNNSAYSEAMTIGVNNRLYYQNIALGFDNCMQDTSDSSVHTALIGIGNSSGHGGYNIAIGEHNSSAYEGIALGRNNSAYGWSIAMGVRNYTAYVLGGHSTIIGFDNSSTSTLYGIQKPTYELLYGMPLETQKQVFNYFYAFSSKYSDYIEDHIDNLSGMKADMQSAYNLMNDYIPDDDFDESYEYAYAATTIDDLIARLQGTVFETCWYTIVYAQYSETPGVVPGEPVIYENNSIIMGVNNISNHYNSILIGLGNTSLAPAEEVLETDDDGFTVAIGFKNVVARNYDMAIGYQSKAMGGENIAITNSEAVGFRNLAYNHSIVSGICNTALNESTLKCTQYDDSELPGKFNVFNTLLHSDVTYHNRYEQPDPEYPHTGVAISCNHFENVKCTLSSLTGGASANIVFGNGDISSQYGIIPVNISAESINDNIIALPTKEFNMQLCNRGWQDCSVSRNILLLDDYIKLTDIRVWTNNIALLSDIRVQMDESRNTDGRFNKNVFIDSTVSVRENVYTGAYANAIANNIVCSESRLYLGSTTGSISNNILLSGASLEAKSTNTVWTNDSAGNNYNFLVGSSAKQVVGCVSFCDGQGSKLENAMYSRNFGDNTLTNTSKVFVSGDGNKLNTVQHSVVFGDSNEFNSDEYEGRTDVSAGNLRMSEIFVHGLTNKFNYTAGGNYFSRILVSGNGNTVNGNDVHDSMIMGSGNTLGWFGEENPQKASCETIWSANVSEQTIYEVSDTGYLPTDGTSAESIYSGRYYYYRGGAVYRESSLPSGTTYTSISGNDFVQGVRDKTLTDKAYYYVNSSVTTGSNSVPELTSIGQYSVYRYYAKYPDGTVKEAAERNIGVHIWGNTNRITPNVMWSGLLGTASTITNSLEYGISGLFVQGMNQTVSDGSNIICMGAGNVSSGHGSIAIGNQLISDKWQMVIGKYNLPKPGPDRIIPKYDENKSYQTGDVVYNSLGSAYYKCTAPVPTVGMWNASEWKVVDPESEKALFIIGNGYGEDDSGTYWNDESKIHRSNAFEVYADGTVRAKKFVADEPELELTEGNGIKIEKSVNAGTITVAVKQPLPAAPSNPGTYALQCVVDANGNPTYSWVSVGMTNV